MRRLTLIIAALAGLASPARAAPQCTSPADQSAYEMLSLRQQMVVLAFKCSRQDDYNKRFIIRFQPVVQANNRAVLAYFRRAYGNSGQGRMDAFITELVNVMSQEANRQGGEYCARASYLINEMNALRTMDELVAFAAVKDMAPSGTTMCATASAPARRR